MVSYREGEERGGGEEGGGNGEREIKPLVSNHPEGGWVEEGG